MKKDQLILCNASIIVLALLMIFPLEAFTQFRIGVKGGEAISSVLYSSQFQVDEAQGTHSDIQKSINTYYGGIIFQFKAGKRFVIRPSVEYFKKAWQVDANDQARLNTFRFLRKYEIDYIQVPVNIALTTPLAKGRIYIGVGPYLAYGLRGKVKVDNEDFNLEFNKFNEPVYTYLQSDNYKPIQFISHYTINRIDYGANGVFGYEFSFGFFIEAGIDIGMRQISTSHERYDLQRNRTIRDPNTSVKYTIFQVGAGFMLNNKWFGLK